MVGKVEEYWDTPDTERGLVANIVHLYSKYQNGRNAKTQETNELRNYLRH